MRRRKPCDTSSSRAETYAARRTAHGRGLATTEEAANEHDSVRTAGASRGGAGARDGGRSALRQAAREGAERRPRRRRDALRALRGQARPLVRRGGHPALGRLPRRAGAVLPERPAPLLGARRVVSRLARGAGAGAPAAARLASPPSSWLVVAMRPQ